MPSLVEHLTDILFISNAVLYATNTTANLPNTTTSSCFTMSNPNAPIYKTMTAIGLGRQDTRLVANILDSAVPLVAQCLASSDLTSVVEEFTANKTTDSCYSRLNRARPTPVTSYSLNETTQDRLERKARRSCEDAADQLACVNEVLPRAYAALSSPCCEPMKLQLSEWFGGDPLKVALDMLSLLADVSCSTRTMNSKTLTCDTVWNTIPRNTNRTDMESPIANSQVCAAMTGQPYTTTDGKTTQLVATNESTVPDICFEPMNELTTKVAAMPMVKALNLSDLFEDGKCLNVSAMLDVERLAFAMHGSDMPDVNRMRRELSCVHYPMTTTKCEYAGTLDRPFSKKSASSDQSKADDRLRGHPNAASQVTVALSMAVVALLSLIQMLLI